MESTPIPWKDCESEETCDDGKVAPLENGVIRCLGHSVETVLDGKGEKVVEGIFTM
jgi:hypothetical protein